MDETSKDPAAAAGETPNNPPEKTEDKPKRGAKTSAPVAAPPTRCRVIEFTDAEGTTSPAIVTSVNEDGSMNVCAFHPVYGPGNHYVKSVEGCRRDAAGEPETWNWPSRV